MGFLPSIWELLLPNWNIFTVIGAMALILGVLIFVFFSRFDGVLPVNTGGLAGILVLVGIGLIWGISMLQDYWSTDGGVLITLLVVIAVIAFLLFTKKGKSYNIF